MDRGEKQTVLRQLSEAQDLWGTQPHHLQTVEERLQYDRSVRWEVKVILYQRVQHLAFLQPNQIEGMAFLSWACCQRFQWSSSRRCSKDGQEQRWDSMLRKTERWQSDHEVWVNRLRWEALSWGLSTTTDPCSSCLCQNTPLSAPSHHQQRSIFVF